MSDDEEIKLEPMDEWDKPSLKTLKTFTSILGSSSDSAAWNNVPAFLEGLVLCKGNVTFSFYEALTRKSGEVGKEGIIIQCAEISDKTGLKLSIPGVVRELFLIFHTRAAKAKFEGSELDKARRRAEKIALMLEDDAHCGGKLKHQGHVDARDESVVLSVLLELSATDVINNHGGKDEGGKVAAYATRMMHQLERSDKSPIQRTPDQNSKAVENARQLEELLPLWNGIRQALQVDSVQRNAALRKSLESRQNTTDGLVKNLVETVRKQADGKPRRSLSMYEALQV
jgi:hypothetical protein